jgi:hypothetical protein
VNDSRIIHPSIICTSKLIQLSCTMKLFAAFFGFTPSTCSKNLHNFIVYFSCTFEITFDPKTENPKPASSAYLMKQLKCIGQEFGYTMVVMSILAHFGWELFDTRQEVNSTEHSLQDLFSWQHLANNYLVASKSIVCLYYERPSCPVWLIYFVN